MKKFLLIKIRKVIIFYLFGMEIAIYRYRSKNINGGLDKDVHSTEKILELLGK